MISDLTTGKPLKILIQFSLPMLVSMIFQQMYSIADPIIAGRMISLDALRAVSAAYPITALFLAVATGSSVGCSVIVAMRFGQGDITGAKSAIHTAFFALFGLSLVLSVGGFLTMKPLLNAIGTSEEFFQSCLLYLSVYFAGIPFLFLYNTANAVFNALGDSRTPLLFLALSSSLSIALGLVFVNFISASVVSLAWATFTAQGLASILAVITLLRRIRRMKTDQPALRFDRKLLAPMAAIAVPSVCQQSFVSVGIFMVQGIINSLGPTTIAAFGAALKISTFATVLINTLPTALTSYASQNIGAGDIGRVKEGVRVSVWIAEGFILIINVLIFVFAEQLMGAFIGGDAQGANAEVISQGVRFLRIVAPFYALIGMKNSFDSVLRGGGVMKQFMATTFADLFLRVVFSYLFAKQLGFYAICLAYPFGWVFGTLLSVVFYKLGHWKYAAERNHITAKAAACTPAKQA